MSIAFIINNNIQNMNQIYLSKECDIYLELSSDLFGSSGACVKWMLMRVSCCITNQPPLAQKVQVVQDVQGSKVHLHAYGSIPWRGAVDHPERQRWAKNSLKKIFFQNPERQGCENTNILTNNFNNPDYEGQGQGWEYKYFEKYF